jgi:hypothetical protein
MKLKVNELRKKMKRKIKSKKNVSAFLCFTLSLFFALSRPSP